MLGERRRVDAEQRELDAVVVGDDASVDALGGAGHRSEQRAREPAGARLGTREPLARPLQRAHDPRGEIGLADAVDAGRQRGHELGIERRELVGARTSALGVARALEDHRDLGHRRTIVEEQRREPGRARASGRDDRLDALGDRRLADAEQSRYMRRGIGVSASRAATIGSTCSTIMRLSSRGTPGITNTRQRSIAHREALGGADGVGQPGRALGQLGLLVVRLGHRAGEATELVREARERVGIERDRATGRVGDGARGEIVGRGTEPAADQEHLGTHRRAPHRGRQSPRDDRGRSRRAAAPARARVRAARGRSRWCSSCRPRAARRRCSALRRDGLATGWARGARSCEGRGHGSVSALSKCQVTCQDGRGAPSRWAATTRPRTRRPRPRGWCSGV